VRSMFSKLFSSSREKNQIPEVPKLDGTYDFIAIDVETIFSQEKASAQMEVNPLVFSLRFCGNEYKFE